MFRSTKIKTVKKVYSKEENEKLTFHFIALYIYVCIYLFMRYLHYNFKHHLNNKFYLPLNMSWYLPHSNDLLGN